MNKTALTISAILTAFVLVVVGGLAYATTVSAQPAEAPVAENTAVVENTTGLDVQTQQAILEREAAYQAVIDQANNQLVQLQQQNQQLMAQIQTAPSAEPAQPEIIAPELAVQIASQAFGQPQVYSVETVVWNGVTVYQVTFSSGDVATLGLDGQILAMWQAPRPQTVIVADNASGYSDGEHEDEHDDDD